MSQSLVDDFPIDPLVTSGDELADILNRFQLAVNSNNSGGAAPPDMSGGMFWLDTSGASPILKIRNGDNTAWLNMLTMGADGGISSLFADGTQTAPSIAWASEPGLGWFRSNGVRRFVQAGGVVESINATTAGATYWALNPRGPGLSSISLSNAAADATNFNTFVMQQQADGSAVIQGAFAGTATAKSLNFSGWTLVTASMPVHATQFILRDKPDAIWNRDVDNNVYFQMQSNWYWVWNASNGDLSWMRNGGNSFQIRANGQVMTGGNEFYLDSGSSIGLITNNNTRAIRFTGDNWRLEMQANNGNLVYYGPDNNPKWYWDHPASFLRSAGGISAGTSVNAGLDMVAGGWVYAGGTGGIALQGGSTPGLRFTADNWRLSWETGALVYRNNSGGQVVWTDSVGNWNVATKGYQPGGGSWGDNSDERIKEHISPYTSGLKEILSLEPVTFNFKTETGRDTSQRYTRLIAQQAKIGFPELVTIRPGRVGDIELEDMHWLDESPVLWALVNAIKELEPRIRALEGN